MVTIDPYVLLSPEYEEWFKSTYGRQPLCIPVGFINNRTPHSIPQEREYSRTWIYNPKRKKK